MISLPLPPSINGTAADNLSSIPGGNTKGFKIPVLYASNTSFFKGYLKYLLMVLNSNSKSLAVRILLLEIADFKRLSI